MRKSHYAMLLLIVASFIISSYYQPQLPEQVAFRWNVHGGLDEYIGRFWGAYLMPIVLTVMFLLFLLLPRIEPFKNNIESFRQYYNSLILVILAVMLLINSNVLFWNVGMTLNPSLIVPFAVGLLFVSIGLIMPKFKRNWFMGIRTPWTLSSDTVWEKTHQVGGKAFIVAGILMALGSVYPQYALWLILIPILVMIVAVIAYSYLLYRKEQHLKQ